MWISKDIPSFGDKKTTKGEMDMKKKIIIMLVMVGVMSAIVVSSGTYNIDYLFNGKLNEVTIVDLSDDYKISVEDEQSLSKLQSVFFNKFTRTLGPTTSEGGNYRVSFMYQNETLTFDLILNNNAQSDSYVKYHNQLKDYNLTSSDVAFIHELLNQTN